MKNSTWRSARSWGRGLTPILLCGLSAASTVFGPFVIHAQERLGGEFQINAYTTGGQSRPSAAIDANGDFVVVWHSYGQDGSDSGVFGRPFTSGGAAGAEFQVNTYTTSIQRRPEVAVDATGCFVVVWSSVLNQDGDQGGIFGQRFFPGGLKNGLEFPINTYTTDSQGNPEVAMDAAGNFVVVWDSGGQEANSRGVRGQRYTSDGEKAGSQFQVNTYTTSFQGGPSVAMDAAGDFVVVWQSNGQDGSPSSIFGQRFGSDGLPAGTEFPVNAYTPPRQNSASAAMNADGDFIVVWESSGGQDGDGYGIFGRRFASDGTPQGSDFQVNTYTTSSQRTPAVAMDAEGNFVVVWQSSGQDGSYRGIFGQRFAGTGVRLGGEFQVNTYTTGEQNYPGVAMGADGNFIVVWTSDGPDGSGDGVFGQRFRFGELEFFIGDENAEARQRGAEATKPRPPRR